MTPTTNIEMLQPELLLPSNPTRFGLIAGRIDNLKASILEEGRVLVPLRVEAMTEDGPNGEQYKIVFGNYRHAAVVAANKEGAGLLLPCEIVEASATELDNLKTRTAENFKRNEMSCMDISVAATAMLEAGVPKMEVREIFSRPGGRKGNKIAPASNSFINIVCSFQKLPKEAQNRLHDGRISITGGMELVRIFEKHGKDKVKETLDKMEEQRLEQVTLEEKDEEKLLAAEKKQQETEERLKTLAAEKEAAAQKLSEVSKELDAKVRTTVEAYSAVKNPSLTIEEKAAAEAAHKAAEAAEKEAVKLAEAAKKEKEKAEQKLVSASQTAEERKRKLELARAESLKKAAAEKKAGGKKGAATDGKKAASDKDVKKAAAVVGAETNYVPLKLSDIRGTVKAMVGLTSLPKVQAIGKVLEAFISGQTTEPQFFKGIAKITGESK